MVVLLGVLVAAAFGSGDFLGGRASRVAPTVGVLFVAQSTALLGAAIAALVVGADATPRDLAYGALAGALNASGLGLLYQGLATGRMGVVAPVTAVIAAVVPIAWGFATGERPSAAVFTGVVLAVSAGALVAREPDAADRAGTARAVGLALGAGALFGIAFVGFAETSASSGNWPVLTARCAGAGAAAIALVVAHARGNAIRVRRSHPRALACGAGLLDVGATVLLLAAVRDGLLVVVAPLAALAPAFTVVLAWAVLHERITRHQVAGLALALTGLVLIASG
ncbi:MAG: hypothetical protein AMXMBFR46_00990 [Acidimicrobiia bacterium]